MKLYLKHMDLFPFGSMYFTILLNNRADEFQHVSRLALNWLN